MTLRTPFGVAPAPYERILEYFITRKGNFTNEEYQGGKAEVQKVLTGQQLQNQGTKSKR